MEQTTLKSSTGTLNLDFKYLPAYISFIRDHHLDEYVRTQISLSRAINLPVLKYFESFSEEELMEFSRKSSREFLNWIADNKAEQQIEHAKNQWLKNELPILGRHEITSGDLTLISYVRRKTLINLLPLYTLDFLQGVSILSELEDYFKEADTVFSDTYIQILKEQLQRNEEQLLQAQEISGIGSYVWNFETEEGEVTPQVLKILDLKNGDGFSSFFNKMHPDDAENFKRALDEARVNQSTFNFEYRYYAYGEERIIWSRGNVFQENGKNLLKGTVMDITERSRILEQLRHSETLYKQSNADLEEFAYVASHDLKEPLRKIMTFGEMLLNFTTDNLDEKGKLYVDKMIDGSKRMQRMIDDLLALAVISHNKEFEETNLQEVLGKVLQDLEHKIKEKDALVIADALPQAKVIPSQFQQLFLNLLGNSLKFAREGVRPEIRITHNFIKSSQAKQYGLPTGTTYLQIIVADNGIGFEPEYKDKIFGMFQRLHGKVDFEGSGIGLAICKKIVENHGGIINAAGDLNKGAEFSIIIPVR